jgi:hypothetical protein
LNLLVQSAVIKPRTVVYGNRMGSRYFLGTLYDWTPPLELPAGVTWLKGQQERCPTTGKLHHQVIVGLSKPQRLGAVSKIVGRGHWEASRSSAADEYVHKDATSIADTRFELGKKSFRRNVSADWDAVRTSAIAGKLDDIPPDIYVRYYSALCRISADNAVPVALERSCDVYWGPTGTGKSMRAWTEGGTGAYAKDPRTKWWCGYRAQTTVIIDEFRGAIDVAHVLRWLDRYPVSVETKGGSKPLVADRFFITSNLDPRSWYPEIDEDTLAALLRRLKITHFNKPL